MDTLELKNTITEIKNSLQGLNNRFELAKKRIIGTSQVAQCLRSACQCQRHGFEPWSQKIPHAVEQLRPCTTTTEAYTLEPVSHNY